MNINGHKWGNFQQAMFDYQMVVVISKTEKGRSQTSFCQSQPVERCAPVIAPKASDGQELDIAKLPSGKLA